MFDHEKAHVLHVRPVVMNQEARRLSSRIEVLVPGKYRDAKRVAFFPFNALIFDNRVAVARNHVFRLFIAVPMGAGLFPRRNLGEKRADRLHVKSGRRLDRRRDPADPSRLKDELIAAHVNSSCSPPVLFAGSKVQRIEIQLIRLAHGYRIGS